MHRAIGMTFGGHVTWYRQQYFCKRFRNGQAEEGRRFGKRFPDNAGLHSEPRPRRSGAHRHP